MSNQLTGELVTGISGGKFLSFFLGREEYAIEILKVKEIIGLIPVTPVPHKPSYIRGIINLRGTIVPVMDLRCRFGLKPVDDTHETCVIVVQQHAYRMGLVVDKVSEVTGIDAEQIDAVPGSELTGKQDYVAGLAKVEGSVKMIINVEKVLFEHYSTASNNSK